MTALNDLARGEAKARFYWLNPVAKATAVTAFTSGAEWTTERVTVEQIVETIDLADRSTRTGSLPGRQRIVAEAIQRLYQGGACATGKSTTQTRASRPDGASVEDGEACTTQGITDIAIPAARLRSLATDFDANGNAKDDAEATAWHKAAEQLRALCRGEGQS